MNNILILSLGTSKDVIMSSRLISSYKKEHPHAKLSMLVYKEHMPLAKLVHGVHSINTIDQERIHNIVHNPLFSDAHALNQFTSEVNEVYSQHWDTVINFSNDNVSSYFLKSLDAEQIVGTFIDHSGTARTSDQWSTYQNFVLSRVNRYPINVSSVRNHMANLPIHNNEEIIKINPEFLYVANQNFSRIRTMNDKRAKCIVGINLEVGYDGYALDESTAAQIIESLNDSSDYQVVLLTNGKTYQKEIVNNLNAQFNDSLVSINVDSVALSAVLSNLDCLISGANDQLMIADCLDVRVIELKSATKSNINPSIFSEGSFALFVSHEEKLSSDICLCLNEAFETELPIEYLNSENPVLLSIQDDYGQYFTQIRGDINTQAEIGYHIQRLVHFEVLGYPRNNELISHLRALTPRDEIFTFVETQRQMTTEVTRILLSTIKALKEVNNQNSLNKFVGELGKLMQFNEQETIPSSLVKMFEGQIENITSTDAQENLKEIETLLFQLKSHIQLFTQILEDLIVAEKSKTTETEGVQELNN